MKKMIIKNWATQGGQVFFNFRHWTAWQRITAETSLVLRQVWDLCWQRSEVCLTLISKDEFLNALQGTVRGLSQAVCVCYELFYLVWSQHYECGRVTLETSCAVLMACQPGWGCLLCRQSGSHGRSHEGWRMQPWGRTETGCRERVSISREYNYKNKSSEWSLKDWNKKTH